MILVTGGTGFIGGYVALTLRNLGAEVHLLSRFPVCKPETRFLLGSDSIDSETVDVRDADAVESAIHRVRPSTVIHLDAIVDPVSLNSQPRLALDYNVTGTVNVLESSRRNGVERFVYCSSIGVLPTIQQLPVTASHPVILPTEGPGSGFYGASKLAAEAFSLSYCRSFGLDVRIVRPSAVYGFGMQWGVGIKDAIEAVVAGRPAVVETRAPHRDYTHVRDVAALIASIAIHDAGTMTDRVFFAATGSPLIDPGTIPALLRELVPGAEVSTDDLMRPEFLVESRYRGRIDVAPAREQLRWTPAYDLRAGLAEYIELLRDYRVGA